MAEIRRKTLYNQTINKQNVNISVTWASLCNSMKTYMYHENQKACSVIVVSEFDHLSFWSAMPYFALHIEHTTLDEASDWILIRSKIDQVQFKLTVNSKDLITI